MGKNSKAITKGCPHCGMQIAVACKVCPGCRRVLIANTKRSGPTPAPPPPPPPPPPVEVVSRRTSRVKRGKPQFYDASQFEKKKQIKRRKEPEIIRARNINVAPAQSQALSKKKIKKKVKPAEKEEQVEEEEPPPINLTPDKIKQFSIVLNELNYKLFSTSWTAV